MRIQFEDRIIALLSKVTTMTIERVFALLLGLCFLMIGIYFLRYWFSHQLHQNGLETMGTVVEVYDVHSSTKQHNTLGQRVSYQRIAVVQFRTVMGADVVVRSPQPDAKVGQTLNVLYDPHGPRQSVEAPVNWNVRFAIDGTRSQLNDPRQPVVGSPLEWNQKHAFVGTRSDFIKVRWGRLVLGIICILIGLALCFLIFGLEYGFIDPGPKVRGRYR